MATKAELESRISELESKVREREKAVSILSAKCGMEIDLPQVARDMPTGDAPHLSHQEGLTEKLVAILEPALRKHGAKLSCTIPRKTLLLKDNIHRSHGDTILVPVIWGEVMADIIDCAADFGRRCYVEGFKNGNDMLVRMSRGEITAEYLEDGLEKAIRRQERKDVRMLIKSNVRMSEGGREA